MADAVAGRGEPQAVAGRKAAQEAVIVGVLEIGLQDVVVHVGHADLGAHPFQTQGFEFQSGQGAGGVLGESLVDYEGNFFAGLEGTFAEVGFDYLPG